MVTAPARQNSTFYTHRLDNGLQLLGQHMPGTVSAASIFWVRTGTRDETARTMGVSHFLEHMAFRRSQTMTQKEIDGAFERMGAEYNAATWLEMTYYWARVLASEAPRAIELLSELTHPMLDQNDFDQERPVILEEIARFKDQPAQILFDHFMGDFFRSHPLSWETLGTPETIKQLTVEEMREYWDQRYGASNMLFAIAGNFDWDAVVSQIGDLTSSWGSGASGREVIPVTFEPSFNVYTDERFAQEQFALGTPSLERSDPRYYAAAVLATIFGDDTGSRLFWALHETGLAESATSNVMVFEGAGLFLTHLSTEPGQAAKALEIARSELARLQTGDITDDELDRAKAKLISSVVIGGESTNDRVMGLIRSWLAYEQLETLHDLREKIEGVTRDDLRELLDAFPVAPDQVIVASGPASAELLV